MTQETFDKPDEPPQNEKTTAPITLCGSGLTISDIVRVARRHVPVTFDDGLLFVQNAQASYYFVEDAAESSQPIYGVTSGFGGMASVVISPEDAAELQNNLIWYHKAGAGQLLPVPDVRAAMLLRANTLLRGVSGVRMEIVRRLTIFLNENVTPHVYELGSIGASGDLVPLTYIAGALIGLDPRFIVDFRGEKLDALTALERLGLEPLPLRPKEGLALINGTSVMTGIAANCVHDTHILLALTLGAHALDIQAMYGTNQSFHPYIHAHKPHPGQIWAADQMLTLLNGSQMSRNELDGRHDFRDHDLIQDRYSMRCLAQYIGPVADGLRQVGQQVEVEANSATDNPLIDTERGITLHGGNFLGEYIGVAMDQLRYYIGLLAKHLDAQVALMVAPEFNRGLSPCLIGNTKRAVNMGLKGLQLSANSIMPMLLFYGNSIADRYPTHAEQFNQNINSQGFNSANLAHRSVEIFKQYIATALIFGVQGVDLRTRLLAGHYDARALLSPATVQLYEAVREVVKCPPSAERPYLWNDYDQPLDQHIALIAADIAAEGRIPQAVQDIVSGMGPMDASSLIKIVPFISF
jgi:phenylalanine ammonia-lyase